MLELHDRSLVEPPMQPLQRTGSGPPKAMPDAERFIRPPWPRRAKLATIGLLIVAIAGVFGTAIRWNGDDGTATDAQVAGLEMQVRTLTEQRDSALGESALLHGQLDDLETQLGTTASELAALRLERTAVGQDLAAAESRIDELTGRVVELDVANDTLATDLAAITADRDTLAALFPVTVEPVLGTADIDGTYDVTWIPAYNSGLAGLTLPSVHQVTITRTADGWLRLTIPGIVTADLTRTDGALMTIVDTTTMVPKVDGQARTARVAISLYANATDTGRSGTTTVTGLGLSIAISTPATATTPAGVALYGAGLTPHS